MKQVHIMNVLSIDHQPEIRDMMSLWLANQGQVGYAADTDLAYIIKQVQPDTKMVVTDGLDVEWNLECIEADRTVCLPVIVDKDKLLLADMFSTFDDLYIREYEVHHA